MEQYVHSPVFGDAAEDIFEELTGTIAPTLSLLKERSYKKYMKSLVDYYAETKDESVIIAKLADRIDNTLADWPAKFQGIIKIYSKNELILNVFKDIIKKTSEHAKLLFILVVERSIDQLNFLIKNYGILVEKRGIFYGQQYSRLLSQLKSERSKFEPYEELIAEMLEYPDVKKLIETLEKN